MACSPLEAVATTIMSGCRSSFNTRPSRTTAWSSTHKMLILGFSIDSRTARGPRLESGDRDLDDRAVAGTAANVELAADLRHAFPHRHHTPVVGCPRGLAGIKPAAVIRDTQADPGGRVAQGHAHQSSFRVANDIAEGLLCNSKELLFDDSRVANGLSVHPELEQETPSTDGFAGFLKSDSEWAVEYVASQIPDRLACLADACERSGTTRSALAAPSSTDKLWFYQGNRWWGGSEYIPGAYFNQTVGSLFYTPDLNRPAWSSNWARDFGGRLTWQAAEKHKITYTHNVQRNCNCINATSATTAPEASTNSDNYWNHVAQGTWVYPATTRLLFDAGVSFGHFPQSSHLVLGTQPETVGIRELSTGLLYNARASIAGITDYGEDRRRDNLNGRASVSYVTGSHAFKGGFRCSRDSTMRTALFRAISPTSFAMACRRRSSSGHRRSCTARASAASGSTRRISGQSARLTVNYGLRFDYFRGYTLPEHIPATQSVRALVCPGPTNPPCDEAQVPTGRFVGARDFEGIDNVPNFKDLSPRLSVAYNLFGDARTAVKGSLHRYVAGLGVGLPNSVHPALATVSNVTRTWDDRNGNFAPDCNLSNPGAQDLTAPGRGRVRRDQQRGIRHDGRQHPPCRRGDYRFRQPRVQLAGLGAPGASTAARASRSTPGTIEPGTATSP